MLIILKLQNFWKDKRDEKYGSAQHIEIMHCSLDIQKFLKLSSDLKTLK